MRGSDTPHILDLVLTDVPIIDKIDQLAPLEKSLEKLFSILMIITSVLGYSDQNIPKFNLAKGDYDSFREYMSIDWLDFFPSLQERC